MLYFGDFGRWAKGLIEKHGASMSSEASGTLEKLPPWVADLGAPVDDLRRLVELLARELAQARAEAEDWERKYDSACDDVTWLEDELDRAREALQEVRNG